MTTKKLQSKKKMMLDFLYEKKARALATYKLAKEESDKIYAQ